MLFWFFFYSQFVVKKYPKNYPKELPNCSHCGRVTERDVNVGINIKIGRYGIESLEIVESGVLGLLSKEPTQQHQLSVVCRYVTPSF